MMPTIHAQAEPSLTPKLMISKILVALDYLADSPRVFRQALDIAEKFQAQLHIFHCVKPQPVTMPEIGAFAAYGGMIDSAAIAIQEEQFEEELKKISLWLEDLAEVAEKSGISVTFERVVGNPEEEICAIAETWKADLIVVGRRGLKGISEMFLGSVSSYLLHHAPCSVMVVQLTPSNP